MAETGRVNPYVDHAELGRALRVSRADAVRVGRGFVADPRVRELEAALASASAVEQVQLLPRLIAAVQRGMERAGGT